MRVLLDATAIPADRGGVGRYVDELVPALTAAGVQTQVVCQPRDLDRFAAHSALAPLSAGQAASRASTRLLWEQLELPRLVRRSTRIRQNEPTVLHSPHYTQPVRLPVANVVTVHDATFFTDPDVHSRVKGPFFRAATRRAVRRAGHCVVPSRATADELVRLLHADRGRLTVAHHGVDAQVFAPPTPAQITAARDYLHLEPGQEYIAFLGTLEPRKNVPALIAGWRQAVTARAKPPALVLAGGRGWDDAIEPAVAAVSSSLTLLRPGYLPLELLSGYLGGASVVCYPSLYEGFGLPVLEAMACGAAVLTTDRGPLPEVGADTVAYTEPESSAIAGALSALLDAPQRRTQLGRAALTRSREFTWAACAQAHIDAYEAALSSARSPL